MAEITTPAFQEPVYLGDQLTDRDEGSLPARELTDSLSSSNHGLGRRSHVEVATVATETVAVVPQRNFAPRAAKDTHRKGRRQVGRNTGIRQFCPSVLTVNLHRA